MKDRYLYRAKRTDNEEWVEGLLTIMWGQLHIINPNDEYTAYQIDQSTICKCTGLKDKNGKLIWENDIIKYADTITKIEKIYKIKWNETNASFVRLHKSEMGLQYLHIDEFIANICEVIASEIVNVKNINVGTDDVCEWRLKDDYQWHTGCRNKIDNMDNEVNTIEDYIEHTRFNYCPFCRKKIKVVE